MPSPRLILVVVLALALTINASVERLCLNACRCSLSLSEPTARLSATCLVDTEFPSLHDVNVSLILLHLGNGEPLKELEDFRCDNCRLDGIDHDEFDGVTDVDPATLAAGVLVELPTEALEDTGSVILELIRSDIVDCDAFLREFGGLRPTVRVVGCGDADSNYSADEALPRARLQRDDTETTLDEKDSGMADENDTTSLRTPSDARQRNGDDELVTEDADEGPAAPGVIGIQPLVPVIPDEDPATVFPPWTIAVISIIGAIIVIVAGYYIWQKWTEIRSCCCGSGYRQP